MHQLVGSARLQLAARSQNGFDERLAQRRRPPAGVRVAAPMLRENVAVVGPHGRQSVQLIGVTAAVTRLGGFDTRELGLSGFRFSGGVILPESVADAVGVEPGDRVTILAFGVAHTVIVAAVLKSTLFGVLASSPVAVALLAQAQRLAGLEGRVSRS